MTEARTASGAQKVKRASRLRQGERKSVTGRDTGKKTQDPTRWRHRDAVKKTQDLRGWKMRDAAKKTRNSRCGKQGEVAKKTQDPRWT
ncbi:hypothetical protein NDU88_003551 [Pleurodeles waltl]|uniref:Uncharacterized protein n=1 Tax=Pleurodeles waltl TaxID=8319 RepID=A0AAV7MR21_PLEWA|nr:hypothetical protein NDU88_003551 [Pleurodeles waltl]